MHDPEALSSRGGGVPCGVKKMKATLPQRQEKVF